MAEIGIVREGTLGFSFVFVQGSVALSAFFKKFWQFVDLFSGAMLVLGRVYSLVIFGFLSHMKKNMYIKRIGQ